MKILTPIFCTLFFFASFHPRLHSQGSNNEDLSQNYNFVPPSPEAASLGKYGAEPVDLSTGAVNVSIPITSISGREISWSVSVGYSTSGIRVRDVASSVGLGWNLRATGVITRSVRGLPDEWPNSYYAEFDNWNDLIRNAPFEPYLNSYASTYREKLSAGVYDLQPDQYSLNIPGYSGTIIIDQDMNAHLAPYSDIKIVPIRNSQTQGIVKWKITAADGTVYKLETQEVSQMPTTGANQNYVSAWYLTEVSSPNNLDLITFGYGTCDDSYTFDRDRVHSAPANNRIPNSGSICYAGFCGLETEEISGLANTNQLYLNNITMTTSGQPAQTIEIITSGDRQDLENAEAGRVLNSITTKQMNTTMQSTMFAHSYFDGQSNGTWNSKRLRLDEIKSWDRPAYKFIYNETHMPAYDSYATDKWGYYNGIPNSSYVPKLTSAHALGYHEAVANPADKSTVDYAAQACMLEEIIYPSGGKTKFTFEAHRRQKMQVHEGWIDNVFAYGGLGNMDSHPWSTIVRDAMMLGQPVQPNGAPNVNTTIFKVEIDQFGLFESEQMGGNSAYTMPAGFRLYRMGNDPYGLVIFPDVNDYISFDIGLSVRTPLFRGKYALVGMFPEEYSTSEGTDADIIHTVHSIPIPNSTELIGGVRIKQIDTYGGSAEIHKTYHYAKDYLNNLENGQVSSAEVYYDPKFYHRKPCVPNKLIVTDFSVNANGRREYQRGHHIGYSEVTEMQVVDGQEIFIKYEFDVSRSLELRGKPKRQTYYLTDDTNSSIPIVYKKSYEKEWIYHEGLGSAYNQALTVHAHLQRGFANQAGAGCPSLLEHPWVLDFARDIVSLDGSQWAPVFEINEKYHFYDEMVTTYLDQSTEYNYGLHHTSPINKTFTSSGVSRSFDFKYAHDVNHTNMINAGMINVPIELKINGGQGGGKKTIFGSVGGGIIAPIRFDRLNTNSQNWEWIAELSGHQDGLPTIVNKRGFIHDENLTWNENLLYKKTWSDRLWSWEHNYNSNRRLHEYIDIDGQSSSYDYDNFHRLQFIKTRDDQVIQSFDYNYKETDGKNSILKTIDFNDAQYSLNEETEFDDLGAPAFIKRINYNPDGSSWLHHQSYNSLNKISMDCDPSSGGCIDYRYEQSALQRPISEKHSNWTKSNSIEYYTTNNLFLTRTIDEDGKISLEIKDGLGRLRTKTNPEGISTNYEYDDRNNITKITGPAGIYEYLYDGFGRLEQKMQPDGVYEDYTYYENDLLQSKTDAKGQVLFYVYNEFGELEEMREGSATGLLLKEITYYNAGLGKKGKVESETHLTAQGLSLDRDFDYDAYGRLITQNTTTPYIDGTYSITSQDFSDRIHSHQMLVSSLQSPLVQDYTYDNGGRLSEQITSYDGMTNNHYVKNYYTNRGWTAKRDLGLNQLNNALQSVDYSYNGRGWLTGINDVDEIRSLIPPGPNPPLGCPTDPCPNPPTGSLAEEVPYEIQLELNINYSAEEIAIASNSNMSLHLEGVVSTEIEHSEFPYLFQTQSQTNFFGQPKILPLAYPDNITLALQGEVDLDVLKNTVLSKICEEIIGSGVVENLEYKPLDIIFIIDNSFSINELEHHRYKSNIIAAAEEISRHNNDVRYAMVSAANYCDLNLLQPFSSDIKESIFDLIIGGNTQDLSGIFEHLTELINKGSLPFRPSATQHVILFTEVSSTAPSSLDCNGKPQSDLDDVISLLMDNYTNLSIAVNASDDGRQSAINNLEHLLKASSPRAHLINNSMSIGLSDVELDRLNIHSLQDENWAIGDEILFESCPECFIRDQIEEPINSLFPASIVYNSESQSANLGPCNPPIGGCDLFAQELEYEESNSAINAVGRYNGNISSMSWIHSTGEEPEYYAFQYDKADRLISAEYSTVDPNQTCLSPYGHYNSVIQYTNDGSGNISSIQRNGAFLIEGPPPTATGEIDDLSFSYTGNRLTNITEQTDPIHQSNGFKTSIASGNYTYDANGNLLSDQHKSIINITYDIFNKPMQVDFADGSYVKMDYDADGNKLMMETYNQSTQETKTWNYLDGVVTGEEETYNVEGGRILLNESNPAEPSRPEYVIDDHLGNGRVWFSDLDGDGLIPCFDIQSDEILQQKDYYPFGMTQTKIRDLVGGGQGTNVQTNRYQYNGKELESDLTG